MSLFPKERLRESKRSSVFFFASNQKMFQRQLEDQRSVNELKKRHHDGNFHQKGRSQDGNYFQDDDPRFIINPQRATGLEGRKKERAGVQMNNQPFKTSGPETPLWMDQEGALPLTNGRKEGVCTSRSRVNLGNPAQIPVQTASSSTKGTLSSRGDWGTQDTSSRLAPRTPLPSPHANLKSKFHETDGQVRQRMIEKVARSKEERRLLCNGTERCEIESPFADEPEEHAKHPARGPRTPDLSDWKDWYSQCYDCHGNSHKGAEWGAEEEQTDAEEKLLQELKKTLKAAPKDFKFIKI